MKITGQMHKKPNPKSRFTCIRWIIGILLCILVAVLYYLFGGGPDSSMTPHAKGPNDITTETKHKLESQLEFHGNIIDRVGNGISLATVTLKDVNGNVIGVELTNFDGSIPPIPIPNPTQGKYTIVCATYGRDELTLTKTAEELRKYLKIVWD